MDHRHHDLENRIGRWTGDLSLPVRTAHAEAPAVLEFAVHPDVVVVRHGPVTVAVLDRHRLRDWLIHPTGLYTDDDVTWSLVVGITCIDLPHSQYLLTPDALSSLISIV